MKLTSATLVILLSFFGANAQRTIDLKPKVCGPKSAKCPIGSYCSHTARFSESGICIPRFCANGACPLYSTCDYTGKGRAAIDGRCIQDLCNTRGKVPCPHGWVCDMSGIDPKIADSPGKCIRQICGTRGHYYCPKGLKCDMSRTDINVADGPGICIEA